jgi:hypothetical protein
MSEQINDGEVMRLTIIRIRTPWVEEEVYITEEQAARWQADPDLCAARYFGLSVEEYREWVVETFGTPLCGARTKSGHLCRNIARSGSFDAETWKRLHRRATCHSHSIEQTADKARLRREADSKRKREWRLTASPADLERKRESDRARKARGRFRAGILPGERAAKAKTRRVEIAASGVSKSQWYRREKAKNEAMRARLPGPTSNAT